MKLRKHHIRGISKRFLSKITSAKNVTPRDYTTLDNYDPIALIYRSGGNPVFIRVPIEQCRIHVFLSFRCAIDSPSPFVRVLLDYLSGHVRTYRTSALEDFYQNYHPKSARDFMGIPASNDQALATLSPFAAIWPWSTDTPIVRQSGWRSWTTRENAAYGADIDWRHGNPYFGPVSSAKGEFEYQRSINVLKLMQSKRYGRDIPNHDNISAFCLIKQIGSATQARYVINGGNHRVAALVALGHSHVSIQIGPANDPCVIHRQDVDHWPAVTRGIITRREALIMFDRAFDGVDSLSSTADK